MDYLLESVGFHRTLCNICDTKMVLPFPDRKLYFDHFTLRIGSIEKPGNNFCMELADPSGYHHVVAVLENCAHRDPELRWGTAKILHELKKVKLLHGALRDIVEKSQTDLSTFMREGAPESDEMILAHLDKIGFECEDARNKLRVELDILEPKTLAIAECKPRLMTWEEAEPKFLSPELAKTHFSIFDDRISGSNRTKNTDTSLDHSSGFYFDDETSPLLSPEARKQLSSDMRISKGRSDSTQRPGKNASLSTQDSSTEDSQQKSRPRSSIMEVIGKCTSSRSSSSSRRSRSASHLSIVGSDRGRSDGGLGRNSIAKTRRRSSTGKASEKPPEFVTVCGFQIAKTTRALFCFILLFLLLLLTCFCQQLVGLNFATSAESNKHTPGFLEDSSEKPVPSATGNNGDDEDSSSLTNTNEDERSVPEDRAERATANSPLEKNSPRSARDKGPGGPTNEDAHDDSDTPETGFQRIRTSLTAHWNRGACLVFTIVLVQIVILSAMLAQCGDCQNDVTPNSLCDFVTCPCGWFFYDNPSSAVLAPCRMILPCLGLFGLTAAAGGATCLDEDFYGTNKDGSIRGRDSSLEQQPRGFSCRNSICSSRVLKLSGFLLSAILSMFIFIQMSDEIAVRQMRDRYEHDINSHFDPYINNSVEHPYDRQAVVDLKGLFYTQTPTCIDQKGHLNRAAAGTGIFDTVELYSRAVELDPEIPDKISFWSLVCDSLFEHDDHDAFGKELHGNPKAEFWEQAAHVIWPTGEDDHVQPVGEGVRRNLREQLDEVASNPTKEEAEKALLRAFELMVFGNTHDVKIDQVGADQRFEENWQKYVEGIRAQISRSLQDSEQSGETEILDLAKKQKWKWWTGDEISHKWLEWYRKQIV